MAWTNRYVTAAGAGAHDGTEGNEWTLAEAIAGVAAGQRVYIFSAAANTTTTRTFATAGTATAPIMWVGCFAAADDITGSASVTGNNSLTKPGISFTTGQMVISGALQRFVSLDITSACTTASGAVSVTGATTTFMRCRITNTAANANARALTSTTGCQFIHCYFSATTTADRVCSIGSNSVFAGCSVRGGIRGLFSASNLHVVNTVVEGFTTTGLDMTGGGNTIVIFGVSTYGGTNGIVLSSATNFVWIMGCVFSTHTNGVNQTSGGNSSTVRVNNCQFYSCTNPIVGVQECATASDDLYVQQGNVTLASDPYVNAAGHDFTLTSASLARRAGIPGAFENESYTSRLDCGAVQRAGGLMLVGMGGGF